MPTRMLARPLFYSPDRDSADVRLVERLNQGDAAAFREIFDAYAGPLVLYARSLMRSGTEPAEDVVHDLFTYLWTHRHVLAVEGALRTYLYRATRNRCWSVLRHERVKRAMADRMNPDADAAPAPVWQRADGFQEARDLGAEIDRALGSLPDRPREIWCLNRMDRMSYAEIARVLGLSAKTVETHMGRALKALRIALRDWK